MIFSEKNFKFYFHSLNKNGSKEKKYKYRLVGLNDEWVIVNNEQEFAEYNNLNPGSYRFEVLAMDNSNVTSKKAAFYNFEIKEVLYKTWWFRLLVFTLLVFCHWHTILYQIKK